MRRLIFTIFFLGIISALPDADESRIVGGHRVPEGLLPFMAALYVYHTIFCGGTLITKRHVLTAAHCFKNNYHPSDILVAVNSITDPPDQFAFVRKVKAIKVHELHVPNSKNVYDIALLTLMEDVTQIKPVKLATFVQTFNAEDKLPGLVAGWGLTNPHQDSSASKWLLSTELNVLSNGHCNTLFRGWIRSITHICAYYPPGGRDTCSGDSGGPLLIGNRTDGFFQVGILSMGPDDCGAVGAVPGIYVRANLFRYWITINTEVNEENSRGLEFRLPTLLESMTSEENENSIYCPCYADLLKKELINPREKFGKYPRIGITPELINYIGQHTSFFKNNLLRNI